MIGCLEPSVEPSTRLGRRLARMAEGGGAGCRPDDWREILIAATRQARAIQTKVEDVNLLSDPGRGVILIKLT